LVFEPAGLIVVEWVGGQKVQGVYEVQHSAVQKVQNVQKVQKGRKVQAVQRVQEVKQ
jgi:hypothetical protein